MRPPARGDFIALLTAVLLVPAVLLLAACGSNSKKTAAAPTTPGTIAPLAASSGNATTTVGVDIQNIAFPETISVKPGTKVTWTNKDTVAHTVSSDSGQAETFDSKDIAAGASFSMTFAKAGTYSYHCNIHSSMHGKIVVGDQASGVSTPAAAPTTTVDPYKY